MVKIINEVKIHSRLLHKNRYYINELSLCWEGERRLYNGIAGVRQVTVLMPSIITVPLFWQYTMSGDVSKSYLEESDIVVNICFAYRWIKIWQALKINLKIDSKIIPYTCFRDFIVYQN